jgi:hypothetical protein
MLEQLPAPSQVGKTRVGGIDLNKPRVRWVGEAVVALSPSAGGFTASELASLIRALGKLNQSEYDARRAAYDLKKLRGKQIVSRIGKTRRYETVAAGLKALRNKAIQPLLAAAQELRPSRQAQNPRVIDNRVVGRKLPTTDNRYDAIRLAMKGVFQELGIAA